MTNSAYDACGLAVVQRTSLKLCEYLTRSDTLGKARG